MSSETHKYHELPHSDKPAVPPQHLPQTIKQRKNRREALRSALSTIGLFLGALLLALSINAFVFQSYEVDGSSMEPTLQNGNRLIIWKLPRTWSKITRNAYVPARGDIIVFHKPGSESEQLIKRVIALPGERVVVKNGVLTVFNSEHPEGFLPDEAMDYGKDLLPTTGFVDTVVEDGRLFVCGDNRGNGGSLDSRFSLGTIPQNTIVGKLSLRLFPFNAIDSF